MRVNMNSNYEKRVSLDTTILEWKDTEYKNVYKKIFSSNIDEETALVKIEVEGILKVLVGVSPEKGAANKRAAELLAKHFDVSKSSVTLVRGSRSRIKTFEININ